MLLLTSTAAADQTRPDEPGVNPPASQPATQPAASQPASSPGETRNWYFKYAPGRKPHGPYSEAGIRRLFEKKQIRATALLWRIGLPGWAPLWQYRRFADLEKWFYREGDKKQGPFNVEQMRYMFLARRIGPGTMVWRDGFKRWYPMGVVRRFAEVARQRALENQPPRSAVKKKDEVRRRSGGALRLSTGIGYCRVSKDDATIGGARAAFELAGGASPAPGVLLHANLIATYVFSPSMEVGGREVASPSDASLSLFGFGAGVTGYAMPSNIFGSLVVTGATLRVDGGGISGHSDWGVVLQLLLGKEWWAAERISYGLAARLLVGAIPVERGEALVYVGGGLGLSLTLN
jgi:hypothetical protein